MSTYTQNQNTQMLLPAYFYICKTFETLTLTVSDYLPLLPNMQDWGPEYTFTRDPVQVAVYRFTPIGNEVHSLKTLTKMETVSTVLSRTECLGFESNGPTCTTCWPVSRVKPVLCI